MKRQSPADWIRLNRRMTGEVAGEVVAEMEVEVAGEVVAEMEVEVKMEVKSD